MGERPGLRPWQFTIVPMHGLGPDCRVAYDCRPWSPIRGRPPLSPASTTAERPASRPASPTHSVVHGCKNSPVKVRYGRAGTPTTYRARRPWSAPSARIDTSVPQSCLSPVPARVDSPIGGCTFPTRVPYGLVATHKKLVQTSRSRPSSALGSPGAQDGSLSPFDTCAHTPTDVLHADVWHVQSSQKNYGLDSAADAERICAGDATFRRKPLYSAPPRSKQRYGGFSDVWGRSSMSSKSPLT
jgi:hypothetical protein